MRRSALLLSLLLVAGCGADEPPPSQPAAAPTASAASPSDSPEEVSASVTDPSPAVAAPAPERASGPPPATEVTGGSGSAGSSTDVPSTVLTASAAAEQAGVDPTGVVGGLRFDDSAGDNVVVLRRIQSGGSGAALLADHVVWPNPHERIVLREVGDGVEDCDLDWVSEFVPESLTVRDSDVDGYGEVEFAYEVGCRGDVGSNDLKLLLLEGGEKHILRGSTFSPFEQFEDPVPEPAADQWPGGSINDALTRFRAYATGSG